MCGDLAKERRCIEERDIYIQRQNLLEEVRLLGEREREMLKSAEVASERVLVEKFDREKGSEGLRSREEKVRQREDDMETRLRMERERMKIDLDRFVYLRKLTKLHRHYLF